LQALAPAKLLSLTGGLIMPAKGTSMRKLTQIIRLHFDAKLSMRPIAKSLSLSVGVVNKYIKLAQDKNLSWPLPDGMDEKALAEFLKSGTSSFKQSIKATSIDFSKIHRELSQKGMTLQLLWEEYQSEQDAPLSYSRYCYHYRGYKKSLKRSMRQTHKGSSAHL
jgi:hypothetical protein